MYRQSCVERALQKKEEKKEALYLSLTGKTRRTDSGQRDEAEVSRIEKRPLLPFAEEESAAEYVADDQEDAQPDGHGLDRLSLLIRGGVVVVVEIDLVGVNLSVHGESHRRHDPRRRRFPFVGAR